MVSTFSPRSALTIPLEVTSLLLINRLAANSQRSLDQRFGDLIGTVLDAQAHLDLILEDSDYHPRPSLFSGLPLSGEAFRLRRSIAALATVAGEILADRPLAPADRLGNLFLGLSCLFQVTDHVTFLAAEAAVSFIHSQFVVKPD